MNLLIGSDGRGGGDLLVIEFGRPLVANLSAITTVLGDIVLDARIEEDGRSVTLLLSDAFQIKTTANGSSIIFDFAVPQSTTTAVPPAPGAQPARRAPPQQTTRPRQSAPTQPPATSAPSVRVRAGVHDTYTRVVFDWPGEVGYEVVKTGDTVSIRFDRAASFGMSNALAEGRLSRIASASGDSAQNTATATLKVPDSSRVRHFRNGRSIVVDILGEGGARTQSTAESVPARGASPAPPPPPAVPVAPVERARAPAHGETAAGHAADTEGAGDLSVRFVQEGGVVSALFEWERPVAAAFFERAGFVWAVFDSEGAVDVAEIPASLAEIVFLAAAAEVEGATAVRMRVQQDLMLASASRVGGSWRIAFRR